MYVSGYLAAGDPLLTSVLPIKAFKGRFWRATEGRG